MYGCMKLNFLSPPPPTNQEKNWHLHGKLDEAESLVRDELENHHLFGGFLDKFTLFCHFCTQLFFRFNWLFKNSIWSNESFNFFFFLGYKSNKPNILKCYIEKNSFIDVVRCEKVFTIPIHLNFRGAKAKNQPPPPS